MSYIGTSLRHLVIQRAQNRCEYCHLAQQGQAATFHIDHIKPVTAGGQTNSENLALACVGCSLYKAAKQNAVDPQTQQSVDLFNPRQDVWEEHFTWEDVWLIGKTPIGRATAHALKMNRPLILEIRREEILRGRHP